MKNLSLLILGLSLLVVSCSKKTSNDVITADEVKKREEASQKQLSKLIANTGAKEKTLHDTITKLKIKAIESEKSRVKADIDRAKQKGQLDNKLTVLNNQLIELNKKIIELKKMSSKFQRDILIQKQIAKRNANGLSAVNEKRLSVSRSFENHTKLYNFKGKYKVMVIPVQFKDKKFANANFFKKGPDGDAPAQDYIFGKHQNSLTSYYKHSSMGKLDLSGVITDIITVDKPLESYGAAVDGSSDRNARGLVVEALEKLKKIKTDEQWWLNFDNWDLSDYDRDGHFHEPDGFVDAVILIYAGKSQASCQRSFDKDGVRPATSDVAEGPRKKATVECFNRIWPHRWSIALNRTNPLYNLNGPIVEGLQRPSSNGLKIFDSLYALDYNMQSEFSDRSTFIHEFGHSLSLPDVYSSGKGNSTGSWEIMSANTQLQAQEFSSFSKLSLGWLAPKIVKQGDEISAYLGHYNFVPDDQRNSIDNPFPNKNADGVHILSKVPEYDEDVFRSLVVLTKPTVEKRLVAKLEDQNGVGTAYSGKFDGESRSLKVTFDVAEDSNGMLKFDTLYQIETETTFSSKKIDIEVVTDYDLGNVVINGVVQEELRLISGDVNFDTLAEQNPNCKATEVLSLRTKVIAGLISEAEMKTFGEQMAICQKPIWVTKQYDVSAFKGQKVTLEIMLTTDAGYTEVGILVDNIVIDDVKIDFENADASTNDFKRLANGEEELEFSQFYLMEYRDPQAKFNHAGKMLSYNMDNNIRNNTQSMFVGSGDNLADRFRMVSFDYQPGLLVWYFNSKYGRNSNDASAQDGKGYLLVLNSQSKEVTIPGVFSNDRFFSRDGSYLDSEKDNELKKFMEEQRKLFVCFSHVKYATYQEGVAPKCDDEFEDYLLGLTFQGKKLIYRRERFNELLPPDRYSLFPVGKPFRTGAFTRTGLSTFRPASAPTFEPFKVYKEVDGELVLDADMSKNAFKSANISTFKDADNKLAENKLLRGDSVVVEKKNFSFKVFEPSPQVLSGYDKEAASNSNMNYFRRPKIKVYFSWEK
jgi:immune inhibitor A